ncbi:MAG: helix-turn-helix transcriptional regulator [Nitrospiria bacterium]
MPRSDQQIRQWIILKLLESNEKTTLQRIASELSDPCHERTLRRDLDALGPAGFPVYNERQNRKSYWKLNETYRRFSLPLTATELNALQCGKQLLSPLEGTFIAESIQSLFQTAESGLRCSNSRFQKRKITDARASTIPFYLIGVDLENFFKTQKKRFQWLVCEFFKSPAIAFVNISQSGTKCLLSLFIPDGTDDQALPVGGD